MSVKPEAVVRNIAEVMWETPPEHYDAHSKMLVTPQNSATRRLDFRISSYQPKGYVAPHRHKVQEQIYHILSGEGLMELDGARRVVRSNDFFFFPPVAKKPIYNPALAARGFFVVTTPPPED